ncbi:DNA topoisomerase III [Vibrio gallicus]|uniref:DNA topoisomerase III n=1 Tax=Vibrio gallicus TaxID=190897 RepID=UPI0021C2DFCC|nr:DNA topoisomerase III [Vibrio gallicus]
MSRLFIAEKPSLGRAIAAGLPKPHKNQQGFIECGNGDVVTWCIGHLLEQVMPEEYDERYKSWSMDHLPIVPDTWKLKPRKSASKQLTVVKKLTKQHQQLIHAGDPDREGQLLVDEVIDYCKVSKQTKQAMQRLLVSDLNLSAVKKSLTQMQSNSGFIPLSVSALARSRADWLYGMNMSRAYTLLGKQAGYNGVLSVGRVQTPILGLVVRRDREIEAFVPRDFYVLEALIPYQQQDLAQDIIARWVPSEACQKWQDEDGRVLSRALAENVANRIKAQPAEVKDSQQKQTKQNAPLPYSLSALQIDASKRFNMSAQMVLDTCQSLYEKHKLITYPRSDCRYLPKDHFKEATSVTQAIQHVIPELAQAVNQADLGIKGKAWNDNKVEAHHAIIPTAKSSASLSANEAKVYQLIATQYLMQFFPAAVYAESKLEFEMAGGKFVASGRELVAAGWRVLVKSSNKKQGDIPFVPALNKGQSLVCREGVITDKKTEPPKHFTEATLLQAMTGIARFVRDDSLKKILKETDGLGTEATRAGILDTLFKRGLLSKSGKAVLSTSAGKGLVDALPDIATYPDMTAHWERQLLDMSEKRQAYSPFMQQLQSQLNGLISEVKNGPVPESLKSLPKVDKKPFRKFKKGAKSKPQTRGSRGTKAAPKR